MSRNVDVEAGSGDHQHAHPPPQYPPPQKGTFQVGGGGGGGASAPQHPPPGYTVVNGTPTATAPEQLPCNGLGIGWFLFIIGFLIGIPWYVGAIMLLCAKIDRREKPGCIACAIAALVQIIAIVIMVIAIAKAGHAYHRHYYYRQY